MSSNTTRAIARPAMRFGAGFAAALACLAVTGCTMVGPDFVRPQTPEIGEWLEANAPSRDAGTGLTSRSAPVVAWWETFDDPVLDALVEQAYAQNLSLQAAGARVFQARAQLGIARGELFPQSQTVGVAHNERKISDNLDFVSDVERFTDRDFDFSSSEVGFDAVWELDVWGGFRRNEQSAAANLAAQVANYDDALVTLTGDIAASYINVRALQAAIAITRDNIELQSQSLDLVRLRFRNGVTTELDVAEATALLENTRSLLPGLEADRAQAINALAVLLAQPPSRVAAAIGPSGRIPTARAPVGDLPAELLRRRPDIRAAEMAAAAQSAQIGVAMTALYPQFILAGSIGLEATSPGDLFQASSTTYTFTPGISWNVLNYGRLQNNVRAQDAAYQGLVANYRNTVLNAYAEVGNAMAAYEATRRQAGDLGRSVQAAERASEIAVQQYRDGIADYTRVLNTQRGLLGAQASWIEAQAGVSENLVALYKALGGGWQIREGREFLPDQALAEMAWRTDWGEIIQASGRDG